MTFAKDDSQNQKASHIKKKTIYKIKQLKIKKKSKTVEN